ncbi:C-terminal binding protein [Cellulomonas sp. KRMCY2]|uniref:C-terminal binding protein n=1 Tax=Cellulomonas sp. KRMCY2 TaxID=1304865 RepID=UPI00045EA449|nr:C-terminal binding protein [Cellulomonas sp. KRMCY2]
MTDVVVTDQTFGGVERERALVDRLGLTFADYQVRTAGEAAEVLARARVAFVNFAPMTEDVLRVLAPGAVVIRYGIGYDNVDIEAARRLGVRVCNVPDYGAETVADHTVSMLLSLLRRLPALDTAMRAGSSVNPSVAGVIRGFDQTVVGLVGTGRIGAAVVRRLLPFGFRVVAYDPYVPADRIADLGAHAVGLPELYSVSHAVSLHVPLSPATKHLLDAGALDAMRDDAVLVNTARGGLVDQAALIHALQRSAIAGAALDVVEVEPLEADSPLRSMRNVLLSPHAAFYSESSLAALQRLATEEAERALTGAPLRCEVS